MEETGLKDVLIEALANENNEIFKGSAEIFNIVSSGENLASIELVETAKSWAYAF